MGEIVRRVAFLYATAIGIALVVVSVLRIVPPEVHRLVNRYGIWLVPLTAITVFAVFAGWGELERRRRRRD